MDEVEFLRKENANLREEITKLKNEKGNLKRGMEAKAKEGQVISRSPFGYQIVEKRLKKADNFRVVENIFMDFESSEISLNRLSKKYGFSVNGIKKILTNFTYLGKIKFDGKIYEGSHEPIISSTLFNHVQDKLERKGLR